MIRRQVKHTANLDNTTIREFTGGLNVVDNELNMSSQYATQLVNMNRALDGSLSIRHGTKKFFKDGLSTGTYYVGGRYFNSHLIYVTNTGDVIAVNGAGDIFLIWDEEIANSLPFSPVGWHECESVDTALMSNKVIITNGVDKPIVISANLNVDYLQDLATGSNFYVPVAKYVSVASGPANNYLVLGGLTDNLAAISIGNADSVGTFLGDVAPNDALLLDLASRVVDGTPEIRGMHFFRGKLLVIFDEMIIPVSVGAYNDDGDHVPSVDDALSEHGSISQRTVTAIDKQLVMVDSIGTPTIKKATFGTTLDVNRTSELISPLINKQLNGKTANTIENRIHAGLDRNDYRYNVFFPATNDATSTNGTTGYSLTYSKALKINAWSQLYNWDFQTMLRSSGNKVFYSRKKTVYVQGDDENPYHRDFINEQETFTDGTAFTDGTGLSPVTNEDVSGVPIDFCWELPWADFGARHLIKALKYISIDTTGDAIFTVELYTDQIVHDPTDSGEAFGDDSLFSDGTGFLRHEYGVHVGRRIPLLSMEMVGGSREGFGYSKFGSYFGDGRNTANINHYEFPAEFNQAKLRICGKAMGPLNIIAVTFYYQKLGIG